MEAIDSATRTEFRDTVRKFMHEKFPLSCARTANDDGGLFSRQVWKQMAMEMSLQGTAIEEEFGGSGFGYSLAAIIFEELGRSLAPVPFLATAGLAAEAIRASGDASAQQRLLPAIAAGELVAGVALNEQSPSKDFSAFQCEARPVDGNWLVRGSKHLVLDAHLADMLIVAARGESGVSMIAVRPAQDGVSIECQHGLDGTRRVSTVRFDDATGELIGAEGGALPALERSLSIAQIYLACEMVGATGYLLEEATAFASGRIQFGRKIGSFQAIQHNCADMYVELQFARSAIWAALAAAEENAAMLPVYANIAKLACAEAFTRIAEQTLQIHGGLGFTWEHFVHLYLKRAKASQFLLGTPCEHREVIGRHIGLKQTARNREPASG